VLNSNHRHSFSFASINTNSRWPLFQSAINKVNNDGKSYREAAELYEIPLSTLETLPGYPKTAVRFPRRRLRFRLRQGHVQSNNPALRLGGSNSASSWRETHDWDRAR